MPTITSLVLGDDAVPRLSMHGIMRLRCDMLQALLSAKISKPRLLVQQGVSSAAAFVGILCCCSSRLCQPGATFDCSPMGAWGEEDANARLPSQPLQSAHVGRLKALLKKTKRLLAVASANHIANAAGGGQSIRADRTTGVAESASPSRSGLETGDWPSTSSRHLQENSTRLQERLLHPMVPAGRIIQLRKISTSTAACCDATRGTRDYAAYWITPAYLGRIHVSALMLRDHLPDVVDKVLVMVARGLTGEDIRKSGWWQPDSQ